ncbi:MAG: hypothetical protein JKY53_05595 [Flavobacteriales bacterium]|nr:hypothetical protein [Flavobacteriales bacterium]PCJ58514.1 MAG: hypothetical protein COA79_13445 [Planctomycetota bacterium]
MRSETTFILLTLLCLTFSSCDVYKSYRITEKENFKKVKKEKVKKKGLGTVRQFTYFIPKETCSSLDSTKLKSFAQQIIDRHFRGAKIQSFKMTSESKGHFTHSGFRVIHSTLDILFDNTNCTIIYKRYNANAKGF